MVENHFENNTIICKKPTTIASGWKNVTRPFIRRMLLHFGTRACLFSPDEGACYIFLTRNNCSKFLAYYGVIFKVIFYHTSVDRSIDFKFSFYAKESSKIDVWIQNWVLIMEILKFIASFDMKTIPLAHVFHT